MNCKNCGHGIVKRYSKSLQMNEWKHKQGGNYCKATIYGKGLPFGKVCYCSDAEPTQKVESKEVEN